MPTLSPKRLLFLGDYAILNLFKEQRSHQAFQGSSIEATISSLPNKALLPVVVRIAHPRRDLSISKIDFLRTILDMPRILRTPWGYSGTLDISKNSLDEIIGALLELFLGAILEQKGVLMEKCKYVHYVAIPNKQYKAGWYFEDETNCFGNDEPFETYEEALAAYMSYDPDNWRSECTTFPTPSLST